MTISSELTYAGANKEFQFRDQFVMPLLVRLGFGVVVNYHGTREFGRDVIFGDIDRFGHVVYYGMQIKYESSIGLGDSATLIEDAEQATHNPFRHPQTGRDEFISTFYVANAGVISEQARDNFFNTLMRKGIRDAKLFDGNGLLLLDKSASLNRNANLKERLTGLVQEIRYNRDIIRVFFRPYVAQPASYPLHRLRCLAATAYLAAPFAIENLEIKFVEGYWDMVTNVNRIMDDLGIPVSTVPFIDGRKAGFGQFANSCDNLGVMIEKPIMEMLGRLGDLV
ncbi:MAG: hypothetical protein U0941_22220 [Planctomycetaceae bacterium]